MRVIFGALVILASVVVSCAQADNVGSPNGGGLTLGRNDTSDGADDLDPSATMSETGESASSTEGGGDADGDDAGTTHGGSPETTTDSASSTDGADGSNDGESSTTGDPSTSTSGLTASESGGASSDATTADPTTQGTTTDATTEGMTTDPGTTGGTCEHPAGLYGDCVNMGVTACGNTGGNPLLCIVDDVNNPSRGVCSVIECEDVCDCPVAPSTGNAQVACGAILAGDSRKACYLACGVATQCPNGMSCMGNLLCSW